MAAELLLGLIAANVAAVAVIAAVLILRKPLRQVFGARIAYLAWLAPPLAAGATLLPWRHDPAASTLMSTIGAMAHFSEGMAGGPISWPTALLALWLAGAASCVTVLLWRQHLTIRLVGPLMPESAGVLRAQRSSVGPAIIGVLASRIVLPVDFEQRFDERQQAMVLEHERTHLAGHDVRVNAAIELLRCLNWFNPLIHLAASAIREDQELACDEVVAARFPNERRSYAEALLKAQTAPNSLPLGCYWPAGSAARLKERVARLARPAPTRRRSGLAVVAALALASSFSAWATAPVPPKPHQKWVTISREEASALALQIAHKPVNAAATGSRTLTLDPRSDVAKALRETLRQRGVREGDQAFIQLKSTDTRDR